MQPPSPLLSLICCRVLIIRHWARCALVGWLAILLQLSNNLVLTCPSLPTRQKKNANHQLAYQAPWMDKPFFFKFDLGFFQGLSWLLFESPKDPRLKIPIMFITNLIEDSMLLEDFFRFISFALSPSFINSWSISHI